MSDLREKVRNAILLAHDAAPDGQEPNAMADAAIAVCMEEAARIVEKEHCELCVAAALRALRGEGGSANG